MSVLTSTCEYSVPSPEDSLPSPTREDYGRDFDHSPQDTPRKNKRKLSEPKKRTDFSIKRFCPDSPGSACSDSVKSDESLSDRSQENPPDSPVGKSASDDCSSPNGSNKDDAHVLHQNALIYPGFRTPHCFIPNFYYNGIPGSFPGSDGVHRMPELSGINSTNSQRPRDLSQYGHDLSEKESNSQESLSPDSVKDGKRPRKNYKNMTRERRVEANARERSRVHTISAAFDSLRRAVPSYSYNQKLSKLAILRIACSYINALTCLTDDEKTGLSFAECVDNCTRTIQTEGKARRRH
ncbi:hypothetical protein CHS0354_019056 [Potamilus streckersoni]|uniref:BHLH domain-containing protein n=1 Tax=Potamilus streckersoni TaxID=2493646 RepID=A0AAE0VW43_9BIVA|nr:hypothetical protein CHS0354_019056 [Potamilus streckersoni]